LEDRLVPSQVEWIAGDGNFGTAANWRDDADGSHHVPGPGDFASIGNGNATVTVGASYAVDRINASCQLVLNSGGMLSLANDPFNGSTIGMVTLNSGATLQTANVRTSIYHLVLNSGGTLQTTGGLTTIQDDSVLAGTFNTASGATVGFIDKTQTVNAGTAFNGPGAYYVGSFVGPAILNITGSRQLAPVNFTLSGGVLGGSGTFEVPSGGNFTWTSGDQDGPGATRIDSGGTMTLNGSDDKHLNGRTLENDGTVVWTGTGYIRTSGGATINNTGTFTTQTAQATLQVINNGGLPSTFNNTGTVVKAGDNNAANIAIAFNNNAAVAVHNGALNFAGGTATDGSQYSVDAGTALDLTSGGQENITGTVSGTGAGHVYFSGGTLNVFLAGATFNFAPGVLQWTGGTLTGSGTLTNAGDMTLNGTNDKAISGTTLANTGSIEWTGTGYVRMNNAATITNSGTFTAQTAQATLQMITNSGLPSTFINTGTVAKVGDNNSANIAIAFNNSAAVAVHNGMLNFAGGTATDGSNYSVDAGTALDLLASNGGLTVSGTISGTGAGIVLISGDSGSNGTVIIPVAGATFNFDPGVLQWTGGTIFTSDGGTLTNIGAMTITGTNDKSINTNTPQSNHIDTLDNEGAILWTGTGRILTYNGVILNNGTSFDIQTGDQGDGLRLFNNGGLPSTFTNAGSLTKSAGLAYAHIGIDFENQGSVALSSGDLDLYGGGHNTGNMDVAAGTILAFTAGGGIYYLDAGASITDAGTTEVLNNSTVEVRAAVTATEFVLGNNMGSYGTLQIDDSGLLTLTDPNTGTPYNFTIYNGGVVIEFSGSTPGAGYGQLNVGALAQLGGALYLTMLNGYRPAAGTTFQVLTYASHTQSFGSINGTDLGGGLHLNPKYNATNLTLAATQTGPSSGKRTGDRLLGLTSQVGMTHAVNGATLRPTGMPADSTVGRSCEGKVDRSQSVAWESSSSLEERLPGTDAFFQAAAEGSWNDGWMDPLG
jgi:hypothetical protein